MLTYSPLAVASGHVVRELPGGYWLAFDHTDSAYQVGLLRGAAEEAVEGVEPGRPFLWLEAQAVALLHGRCGGSLESAQRCLGDAALRWLNAADGVPEGVPFALELTLPSGTLRLAIQRCLDQYYVLRECPPCAG